MSSGFLSGISYGGGGDATLEQIFPHPRKKTEYALNMFGDIEHVW